MSSPLRLGVLLSGGGRTLQNLVDRIARSELDAEVACVIADREGCYGLERAETAGLPAYLERNTEEIYKLLREHRVELICLCGYLRLLPIADDFQSRILNIHPALLPKHGGPGYHGHHVHESVLKAGDPVSGCTVHYCDDRYDHGPILVQSQVPVLPGDDADTLAARVFTAECETYPAAIRLWRQLQN